MRRRTVGIGEPAAVHKNGRFFQLADVFGVEKELGFTLSMTNISQSPWSSITHADRTVPLTLERA